MIETVIGLGIIVGALTTLAVFAIAATRRAGSQQARGDVLAVRMEVALANAKIESARADDEKERADALDAAIAECAARAVGPVAGSFAELLQAASDVRTRAARRAGTAVVPVAGDPGGPTEADRRDPDDLLRPGE